MEPLVDLNGIEKYLDLMIESTASDMFLTFGEHPGLRINTKIIKYSEMGKLNDIKLESISKTLLCFTDLEDFKEHYNIDFSIPYKDRSFRINLSRQKGHIMIVIRLLLAEIPNLDSMGPGETFKNIINKPNGIIIVSGPAGSGKSTLLASMIENININKAKHIISIEDPIEYIFKAKNSIIGQKELGKDIESFPAALKAAMRQNPDVILFGEMRDKDSIKNAITLAETGHLVLTTTHSKSAGQTISKIIDSFPAEQQNQIRLQLANSLIAVINQRMLHKKDYSGIVIAQEIMINNAAIANSIRKNDIKNINNTILTSKKQGMQLLENHLIELLEQGIIDQETAIINANNSNYIRDALNGEI